MNKILSLFSVLLLCTSPHAHQNFKGFYMGFEGGLRTFNLNESGDLRYNGVLIRANPNNEHSLAGGLFFGMSTLVGTTNLYTGAEVSFQTNTEKTHKSLFQTTKHTNGGLYRLGLRLGYIVENKFLTYFHGGWGYDAAGIKIGTLRNKNFYFLGTAIEYVLKQTWRMRFIYTYDWYLKQTADNLRSLSITGGATFNYTGSDYSHSPQAHSFMLGLVYQF